MGEEMVKACSRCGEVKPLSAYSRNKRRRDGLQSRCKACDAAYKAAKRLRDDQRPREWWAGAADRKRVERRRAIERTREQQREYYARNRHAYWRGTAAYRLRQHGFPEAAERAKTQTWTRDDLVARYGDACAYCEDGAFEHLDHYVPLASGGEHTLENAVPACRSCNLEKGSEVVQIEFTA